MTPYDEINEVADDHWEMVFSSTKLYRVEMAKSLLEEEGIPSVIVNKQDSAYITIGEIELYVNREDILKGKYIINQFIDSE
jgi:hypothetical protein